MPIYMKFEGVKGAVATGKYAGWIELESCQLGVHRSINSPVGRGANREAATPSVNEIVITKYQDIASSDLFKASLYGGGKKVTIDFVKSDKDGLNSYMTIELENTLVSSYNISGHGGGVNDKPMESLSLNFTKITFSTQSKDPPAKPSPSQTKATWDLGTVQGS